MLEQMACVLQFIRLEVWCSIIILLVSPSMLLSMKSLHASLKSSLPCAPDAWIAAYRQCSGGYLLVLRQLSSALGVVAIVTWIDCLSTSSGAPASAAQAVQSP